MAKSQEKKETKKKEGRERERMAKFGEGNEAKTKTRNKKRSAWPHLAQFRWRGDNRQVPQNTQTCFYGIYGQSCKKGKVTSAWQAIYLAKSDRPLSSFLVYSTHQQTMAGINRKHDDKLVFETSEDVKGTLTRSSFSIPYPPSESRTCVASGTTIYSPNQCCYYFFSALVA